MWTDLEETEQQILAIPDKRERVDKMVDLAFRLWGLDTQKSIDLVEQAHALARENGYERGLILYELAQNYLLLFGGEYEAGLANTFELIERFKGISDMMGMAHVYTHQAVIYRSLGDFSAALQALTNGLDQLNLVPDSQQDDVFYDRSFAWLYAAFAGVHYDLGDYQKALTYYEQAQAIFEKIDYTVGEANSLDGIGAVYKQWGEYDRAIGYHFRSLDINRSKKINVGISRSLIHIGECYENFGDFNKSLEYYEQSLALREELNYRSAMITNRLYMGRVELKMDRPKAARTYLEQALAEAIELKLKPKISMAYELLTELCESLADFRQAVIYYHKFHAIKSELFTEETQQRLNHIQVAHQVEQAQQERELERVRQVELAETLRQLKDTQSQLVMQEKMASLGHLVAGIAHEINNPIGAVNGTADVSARALSKIKIALDSASSMDELKVDKRFQRALTILSENVDISKTAGQRIVTIVRSLKNFARLDEADFQTADVHEGLDSTLTLLQHELKNQIEIDKQYGDIPPIYCNPTQLNQVFMNILMNAIHAILNSGPDTQKGQISLRTTREAETVHIVIFDTGRGIPRASLSKVFDPGFTTKSHGVGTGLGLSISYQIIQRHRGDIQVESTIGQGTTFTIILPISADLDNEDERS